MTGNQTKLDDFVSPSSFMEVETSSDILERQIDESFERALAEDLVEFRGDEFLPSATKNYFTVLSEIVEDARCEEYNVNELEMGLNLATLKGVSGRDLHTNEGSWAYVSGNVKNWIQNLGGIDAFREAGNRLRNAPKKGQFSISSMSADDKIKSSGITPAEEDFRKENGGWF